MVNISHETIEETDRRLRDVIRGVQLKVYKGPYAFMEFALNKFPLAVDPEALALVRDDERWSQLVPRRNDSAEAFTIFRFHFPAGLDNSGFVGWLATHLKRHLGTGVFVVCGHNPERGGIFDYWGCPLEVGEAVLSEIKNLIEGCRDHVPA